MSAITVIARARPPLPVVIAGVLAATFAVGFVAGSSLPRSTSAAVRTGDHSIGDAGQVALGPVSAVTPVLDTTRAYTTIQYGVLVAPGPTRTTGTSPTCADACGPGDATTSSGRATPLTPVLDTTRSYTTIQHGVVVLPRR